MRASPCIIALLFSAGCSEKDEPGKAALSAGASGSAAAAPAPTPAPPPEPAKPAAASNPELDKLCAKAKEARAADPAQQRTLWWRAVGELSDPAIKQGFDAIRAADASSQYALAKEIAQEAGAPGWSCPDLEALLSSMK